MDVALFAVKREQLQEASNILSLYPQLQPLVAVMGWDLLPGKTDMRRKLMQLLWTSKSQILKLEELSFYGNKSDEVSCVEHLCDFLCYQLDLASFVACHHYSCLEKGIQSLKTKISSWTHLLKILFSKDYRSIAHFEMKDVELMHMRYAMESAVLALRAMGNGENNEVISYQTALSYLKDLKIHLEAVNNIPRKVNFSPLASAVIDGDAIAYTHIAGELVYLPKNAFIPINIWYCPSCSLLNSFKESIKGKMGLDLMALVKSSSTCSRYLSISFGSTAGTKGHWAQQLEGQPCGKGYYFENS